MRSIVALTTAFLAVAAPPAPAQTWSSPTDLSAPGGGWDDVFGGAVVHADDRVTAIWSEGRGALQSSMFARGAWGAPATVSDRWGEYVQLTIDPTGVVIAAWVQGNLHQVFAAHYAGGQWSAPAALSPSELHASGLGLSQSGSGPVVAHWTLRDALQTSQFASGAWTPPVDITAKTTEAEGMANPSLVPFAPFGAALPALPFERGEASRDYVVRNATGTVMVVRSINKAVRAENPRDDTFYSVLQATQFSDGAWSAPATIANWRGSGGVTLTLDDAGNAMLLWSAAEGILWSRFSGGRWSSPAPLADAETWNDLNAVVDSGGVVTAVWVQPAEAVPPAIFPPDDQAYMLRSSRFVNGRWTTPVTGVTGPIGLHSQAVYADSRGVVTAFWLIERGGRYMIQTARLTP